MKIKEEQFLLGRLISIRPRRRYGVIDIDTLRDGGWWMPQSCIQRIQALFNEHQLYPYEHSERVVTALRVPLDVIDEVAKKLAEILARYRCDHSTLRDIKLSN